MHKRWAAGEDWKRTGRGLTQTKKLHNILLAEELLATQFCFDDTFAAAQLQNRIRMKRTNEQTNRSSVRSFVRTYIGSGRHFICLVPTSRAGQSVVVCG